MMGTRMPCLSSSSTMWGDGGCGVFVVDGDADQFRPGAGQGGDLLDGARDVGRVGVGHGLHHDWCIAADAHTANRSCNCLSTLYLGHGKLYFTMRKEVELESQRRKPQRTQSFTRNSWIPRCAPVSSVVRAFSCPAASASRCRCRSPSPRTIPGTRTLPGKCVP